MNPPHRYLQQRRLAHIRQKGRTRTFAAAGCKVCFGRSQQACLCCNCEAFCDQSGQLGSMLPFAARTTRSVVGRERQAHDGERSVAPGPISRDVTISTEISLFGR